MKSFESRQVWAETSNGFFSVSAYKLALELETNRRLTLVLMGVIYAIFGKDCGQFKFPIKSDILLEELPVTSYIQKKIWSVERFWFIVCVRSATMLRNLSSVLGVL